MQRPVLLDVDGGVPLPATTSPLVALAKLQGQISEVQAALDALKTQQRGSDDRAAEMIDLSPGQWSRRG